MEDVDVVLQIPIKDFLQLSNPWRGDEYELEEQHLSKYKYKMYNIRIKVRYIFCQHLAFDYH